MDIVYTAPVFFYISALAVLLLGAAVGSFLNVLVLRYNTGRTLLGRSSCGSCVRTLAWYELIPVFSYVMLRGRCRTCHTSFSIQYPIVELLTALLFFGGFLVTNTIPEFLFIAIIFSLYIAIGVYDLKHLIVPNGLSYTTAALACAALFVDFEALTLHVPSFLELAAGPIIATPLFLLWLVSSGKWMGLGDAKLMLSIGWLLGISLGFSAFVIAVWAGALVGLGFIALHKIRRHTGTNALLGDARAPTMKSEIPFAPFLLLGFFAVYFTEINFFALLL